MDSGGGEVYVDSSVVLPRVAGGFEFGDPPCEVLEVDRVRLARLRVSGEAVPSEVIRVVLDHPLEFVFVKARHAGATSATGAAPVLLAAAVRATPAQLPRPRDHRSPPRRACARGAN